MQHVREHNFFFALVVMFVVSAPILIFFLKPIHVVRLEYAITMAGTAAPIGYFDVIDANGNAQGWTLDPDVPAASISVSFYVNGPKGTGILAGTMLANGARPDVNQVTGHPGNHGFFFPIPAQFKDGKPHSIYAYGVDTSSSDLVTLLSGSPKIFTLTGSTLTINTWDYVRGDPNVRLCSSNNPNMCTSRAQPTPYQSLNRQTDSGMGVFEIRSGIVGLWKDGYWADVSRQGAPWVRCFGDIPGACNSSRPPFDMPLTMTLPIMPASAINLYGVTAGAKLLSSFATNYVNPINVNTCVVSPQAVGTVTGSKWAYIVDTYDFGGGIGVKKNVLAHESVGGYPTGATDPMGGVRFERYFFVPGIGVAQQEGQEKLACRTSPTIANCSGNFTPQGKAIWNIIGGTPVPVFESCAPGATGAQYVSQSVPATMTSGNSYTVSITIKNTGGAVWQASSSYKLGSLAPQDNTIWGLKRVPMNATDAIKPGETKKFTFTVTAPTTSGTYNFQWKMLKESVEWFGDMTPKISVNVLPSGPVAQWKFDEGSGLTAVDSSGNGLTGTLINGPAWVAGLSGSAVNFDGINDAITVPSSAKLALTGDMTVIAWVKAADFANYNGILSKTNKNIPAPYDFYLMPSTGKPRFYRGNGATGYAYSDGTAAPALNQWQFIAVTQSGTSVTHYLNGAPNGTGAISVTPADLGHALTIGSREDGATKMKGALDDVRIYNRALSAIEVAALYASSTAAITKKVYLLVYDPVISDGKKLSVYENWNNPYTLTNQVINWIKTTTDSRYNFVIAGQKEITDFIVKETGYKYNVTTYLQCLNDHSTCYAPDYADYAKILADNQICEKLNAGQIDELWMWGAPWFGFYESRLAGPNAFWYNAPPLSGTSCNKPLPIMGFNYERGASEATHNFGHRAESTMTKVYGGWSQDRMSHPWDKFGLTKAQSPSYSFSGCGSIHVPPNANQEYEYSNTTYQYSYCDDFYNYPNLSDPNVVKKSINCTSWGCNADGFYTWWFKHLPHKAGTDSYGKLLDWWKYAFEPGAIF